MSQMRSADLICTRSQRRNGQAGASRKAVADLQSDGMRAHGGLHQSQDRTVPKAATCAERKRTQFMKKKDGAAVENRNLKVWCEHCSIRIAPSEIRVTSDGKAYHQRCYEKSGAGPKVIGAPSRSGNILGPKHE